MDKTTLYQKAMQVWGYDKQLCKLAEEASELSAEACRVLNFHGLENGLAEEIADVEIMIEQLRQNGLGKAIEYHKTQKLHRIAELLGETYEPQ
ncbi:hypothetical protein [Xenorhabdus ehlersii]|uniref:NTP pyrophosphohydrolase MazG putative catalytic core domain-containing protein n=1 Tax=Xenorhabdus ehlersii TaxID=290111 RepID=A0A2D0IRY3_9GAMM|nr:hypothetical protein [Xenorhabdus ehlersii]PHM24614.1 hypothetical protein Xehl_01864 [Xenorhabdus ehlersii]RKE91253.1 hypothetical protein BDE27_1462 [Xenorhabdus ehlersii]